MVVRVLITPDGEVKKAEVVFNASEVTKIAGLLMIKTGRSVFD